MLRLDKVIKPWKESAALNDHINLYGFWNETAFLTKSGDLGMVLSVPGVDYESLDRSEQEYAVKRLEAALKAFGPGFHVYQYLFKSNRPDIPFATYDDPIVQAAIDQRRKFFEAKRDHLYQIEIFYCIMLEGARSKTGVGTALARMLRDPEGAIVELKSQFTNDSMKKLLRTHIERDLQRLDQHVQAFARRLADFMQVEVLNRQGQFTFFRRLLNYDDWRVAGRPQSTQFLDYQVVNSDIEAERDHLRVGDHIVRVLTMKEAITETRPLVLDALLKIPANFYVVTDWTPLPADKARKEVNKRRRHFNMSKTGFVSQMGNDATRTNPRDVLVDESKQADIENLGDCLRALGDGQSLGDFSLTIVLYGQSRTELDQLVAEFTGVFTNADGNLFAETYNQLNAYFATVPGNYAMNLRRLYLLNTNYADLSFLFTILPGEKTNAHLGTEYLAVVETDNSTPYFLNLHTRDVAHTLILGMTGSGKSYLCVFLLQNTQKYKPLTYIFDIGGSFQSLTTIFKGSYLNVGQEARDFTINPFSLPQTKENMQFLFSFFRVLVGLFDLYKIPLLFGLLSLVIQLPFSITKDVRRRKALRYGRRLKGPEMMTPREFNDRVGGDGIGIKTKEMKTMIRIPRRAEAQHMQIIGDTGAGKTMIMLQILRQIKHRGDSAIIYDPAREFVKRFYDPKNGDVILNPLDKRCPYWGPSEELRRRSEAKALAVSLFQPPQDKKGEFFIESPQKIFAFLMAYGPTPEELVKWMSDPQEIDRRLKGTEHAHLIDPRAHQQRAGVLGSLGLVADSLRLLPKKGDGNGEWSATEWAEMRQGWIFITSLPAEREALRPLQSLWIDLLVLRLLNEPKEGQKRAWFVIDELASLQKLPQLHTAITENRKSDNPVILGFQGKAQLEYLYGHLAEVMLSQPATSIWLKTKEPTAGEWVSKFIGKVEIERLRETHFDGSRAGRNFALDRQVEPLVMESEISGLPDLHAYMKYENYVTRFSFPYFDMPAVTTDFDLRDTPDDKLPYDPKNIGAAKPLLRSLALKPEADVPTPPRKSPRTATEIVPQESDAERNLKAQQSLNLRG